MRVCAMRHEARCLLCIGRTHASNKCGVWATVRVHDSTQFQHFMCERVCARARRYIDGSEVRNKRTPYGINFSKKIPRQHWNFKIIAAHADCWYVSVCVCLCVLCLSKFDFNSRQFTKALLELSLWVKCTGTHAIRLVFSVSASLCLTMTVKLSCGEHFIYVCAAQASRKTSMQTIYENAWLSEQLSQP